ncbi:hypothetical protein RhiirA1_474914 [Rhizophagus irregularis]|uniref:Uncharacterized protein n=1 Tax=Rhizophagus irregularis TaxID=588596 RepID=A0A2N0QXR8_9GLOM|nr:hypothetical protein RhiirA1_474914 [Rhizophagus irregularis]
MVCISETLRFGLVSVRLFTVSVKPFHVSAKPFHVSAKPFHVSAKPFHVSAKPFMYRRDPSLCIGIGWDLWSNIGWRGHLDGIGWDFWIGLWLSGCFLNGTSKLRNFLDDI